MKEDNAKQIIVRDATAGYVFALVCVKEPAILHQDRIRDAREGDFRYLVAEADEVVGHACLVFRRPRTWPEDEYEASYPRVIDLMVRADRRGQGFGTAFLGRMEAICAEAGYEKIYLSVDPEEDAAALQFYEKNGYLALEEAPQWRQWRFIDSAGEVHSGAGWDLQLYKDVDGWGQAMESTLPEWTDDRDDDL